MTIKKEGQSIILVCDVCQKQVFEIFRLMPKILRDAEIGVGGHAHLNCIEKQLQRPLHVADFLNCDVNNPIFKGYELGRRSVLDSADLIMSLPVTQ